MYAEIRHDHMFGPGVEPGAAGMYDKGLFAGVTIDAWKTMDDSEDGTVVAQVLMSSHGDIIVAWHDNGARLNRCVLEAIEAAKQDLAEAWANRPTARTVKQSKLYYLKDKEGYLDLIQVNNWDNHFDQRMDEAYEQWQASKSEFHEEFLGHLRTLGYDIDVLPYTDVKLYPA